MIVFKPTYKDHKTGKTKHSTNYYVRHNGKRIALGVSDKRTAEAKARQVVSNLELGYDPGKADAARRESLTAIITAYHTDLTSRTAGQHANLYRSRLLRVSADLSARFIADLTAEKVAAWLKKCGNAARGKAHYRTTLFSFGKFLVTTGRVVLNPFAGLPSIRHIEADRKLLRRALSDADFAAFISVVENSRKERLTLNGRDRAMLYRVAAGSGLRRAELGSITPASFLLDVSTPCVVVKAGKTKNRKEARIPLPASLTALLRPYLEGRRPEVLLWDIGANAHTSRAVRLDLVEAGMRQRVGDLSFDFHSLRVQYASSLARKRVPLAMAQKLMRHSSPVLTANVYSQFSMEELGAEVAKLDG